jgi:hypothetical protein
MLVYSRLNAMDGLPDNVLGAIVTDYFSVKRIHGVKSLIWLHGMMKRKLDACDDQLLGEEEEEKEDGDGSDEFKCH